MADLAGAPLTLPCGLVFKNRLIKSAMSEKMAVNDQPTKGHRRLYERWARGGWAALVTGNIMIDEMHLGSPGDVVVSGTDSAIVEAWTPWARSAHEQGCRIIAQLSHPGRQSPVAAGKRGFLSKTLAPSAIPLNIGDSCIARLARSIIFGTPEAMTGDQINHVVAQFTRAALLASKSGFDGVEIHAGHGFLLSQFLSASSNQRSDEFGGSPERRAKVLVRVLRSIRAAVPRSFCVGVKINTTDHMSPGGFEDMLRQMAVIDKENPDYVQLTGGSFENPQMLSTQNSLPLAGSTTARTAAREGFFLDSSREIRQRFPNLVLIVTGGFRSREGVRRALEDGACDAIGLGRPAVAFPELPNSIMFNGNLFDEEARFDVESAPRVPGWLASRISSVGAGAETKHYVSLMRGL